MGEVYRARDTRLGREVALKVLPASLSSNKDRLDRFEQEARSASALNHPNIVTIYEFGQVDSTFYIAMELVEGNTLRELLASGAIPSRKIVHIAVDVAGGLAKAHEAGIIHRDLKPENLMISKDGFVKILDFGLAKLDASQSQAVMSNSTLATAQTQPGVLMGTVGYMSPEQARGLMVDFKSDQFALGSILYEMVTGNRAFQRETFAETLTAILREEPNPIGTLNPQAPAPLCWVVERCLAKDPKNRYASTKDLAQDLAALRDRLSEASVGRPEAPSGNLPIQRTAFIGRDREVAAVKGLLLREDVRLVTLTGPGGIGKTRLGVQIAGEVASSFPLGVFFVPLSAVNDLERIASTIGQTLGIRETAGQTPLDSLKEYLQTLSRTAMLLFLDNFEHLVAAAPMVADLLTLAPRLKMLVTSRSPLHIYGEHEFPVPSLELPEPKRAHALNELSQNPSVALFIKRAAAIKPDFELTEENASAVATICVRLDGLPLAIELAAARIKLLPPTAIETRLERRLQLLTGGARDLPARQQTLRGAIDLSYDLLTEAEQKLFRRLSVFVSGCTLEAVEAVCNAKIDLELDVLDGMASLVDKSLLQQVEGSGGESRFVMLETIREYGIEKLEAGGDKALTKRAHAAYFLVLAEEWALENPGQGQTQGLNRFEIEHDNFRAAIEWLTESGDAEWGQRLGAALFRFWESRDYLSEGRDRLGKLLKLRGGTPRTRARALFAAGVLAVEQGDQATWDTYIEENLEIARKLGDKREIAISLNARGVTFRDCGRVPASRSYMEESLALWKELGDRVAVARALSNLASVVKLQGDFALARSLYNECHSIFQELGDHAGAAWTLNYQGDLTREEGNTEAARALYQESLSAFRDLGERWGIAGCLADLGNLYRDQKDFAASHSMYAESICIFQELGHKRGIARLLECFACSSAAQSKPERALRLAGAAAALRRTLGTPLPADEQARLECGLERARQAMESSAASAVWLEGWAMPMEKAVQFAIETDAE
jgi:predicted ATPase